MAQYSTICDGQFTSTGVPYFINLPSISGQIEMWNLTKWGTDTNHLVKYATSFSNAAIQTAYATVSNGTADNNVIITSGGFSFVDAGTYNYGPQLTITGIVAATGVVTTSAVHHLAVGDAVLLTQTTGMLQIAGTLTTVTAVPTTTTFTIGDIPTAGFGAAATAGFAKKLLYPDLYVPFTVPISGITTGTTTIITTAVNHMFVPGQEVGFVIPQTPYTGVWGTHELDSRHVVAHTGIPQQAYVLSVTANTLTVRINSVGFTAFAYPTSAQAALGITFPQVYAIGDQNSGATQIPPLPFVPPAITIPGAYWANTRKGVIVGIGDGTTLMHQTSDIVRYRFIQPDRFQTV